MCVELFEGLTRHWQIKKKRLSIDKIINLIIKPFADKMVCVVNFPLFELFKFCYVDLCFTWRLISALMWNWYNYICAKEYYTLIAYIIHSFLMLN